MADNMLQIHELVPLGRDLTSTDVLAVDTGALTAKVDYGSLKQAITADSVSTTQFDASAVKFSAAQTLTDAQKAQARNNIGAASADDLTTETTEREAADNDLESAIEEYTGAYKTDFTMIEGYFVNSSNNNVIANANWSYSDYIPCDDVVSVYARMIANIGIAYYDINKAYISGQAPYSATTGTFFLEKPQNARYIRFNNGSSVLPNEDVVVKSVPHPTDAWGDGTVTMTQRTLTSRLSRLYSDLTMESGYYISSTNGNKNSVPYGRSAFASNFIPVNEINAIFTSMSGTVYGMAYYDGNKAFISGLQPASDSTPQWVVLEPPQNAVYVRFTCYGVDASFVQCRLFYGLAGNTKSDLLNAESPYIDVIGMYDRTIHIGDSLTWSQVWLSNSSQRQAYITYPQEFGKLCGVDASALAFSGATPVTWWAQFGGQLTNHGLHVVFLGTNGGLTDTIATDCPSSDVADFANTNTGCYGKILQTITDNNDKAVLVHVFGNLTNAAITNNVIDQFGVRYGFPVIDIDVAERINAYYHYSPTDMSYSNTLHFNDLGYNWLANIIRNKINALSVSDKFKLSRKH